MEDNQINGQKISKKAYCPNSFFYNGIINYMRLFRMLKKNNNFKEI